jgi:hypothetical protein
MIFRHESEALPARETFSGVRRKNRVYLLYNAPQAE